MTWLRFPRRRRRRIVEIEDQGAFALAVQHSRIAFVTLVIEVTDDPQGARSRLVQFGPVQARLPQDRDWRVVERRRERWRPESEGGIQGIPDAQELMEIARRHGARYARVGIRAPLRISD